jgi:hypothetical protein
MRTLLVAGALLFTVAHSSSASPAERVEKHPPVSEQSRKGEANSADKQLDFLAILGTACGAAFGAALAVAGGIFQQRWRERSTIRGDRALLIDSLRSLSNDLKSIEIGDMNFHLTGVVSAGKWHISLIRQALTQIEQFLNDARQSIDPQEFLDIHAFWTARKAIDYAFFCLKIQEEGLDVKTISDTTEVWGLFKETMQSIIGGIDEKFSEAIFEMENDGAGKAPIFASGKFFGKKVRPGRQFFRIISRPDGEAPMWVRDAWVGLVLPRHDGEVTGNSYQVMSGRESLGSAVFIVRADLAIRILNESSPKAALWWESNTPHLLGDSQLLVFDEASGVFV